MKTALILASILVLTALTQASAQGNDLRLEVVSSEVALPCKGMPLAYDLAKGPANTVALAWVEQQGSVGQMLRYASYSARKAEWSLPRTVFESPTLLHPLHQRELKLAIDTLGRMALVWTGPVASSAEVSQVWVALSEDNGASWKAPLQLSETGRSASQPSFVWREGGGWLATWVEATSQGASQVCMREAGKTEIARISGATAFPATATVSNTFPDGTDVIAFRMSTTEDGCDPWMLRRFDDQWQVPERLGREGWKSGILAGDLVRFSVSAPALSMAWFTAGDGEPRVLLASSPDAGARWTRSSRVDLGHPVSAPDIALLRDGSQLVAWVEGQGMDQSMPPGILLRRYSFGGGTVRPAYVIKDETSNFPVGPRLAVLVDQPGAPVELLLAFEQGSASTRLRMLLLGLPPQEILAELDSSCNCNAGAQTGLPIRGRILKINTDKSTLRIGHDAIPGLFRRGELEVQVSATVLAVVREGRGIMGRIEHSEGTWLMSNVRTYVMQ